MKKLLLSFSLLFIGLITNAQTWVTQATGFEIEFRGIGEIHIIDANTVWGLAYDGSGDDINVQEFTKTTDGGTTWTPGFISLGNNALKIGNMTAVSATTAWISAFNETTGGGGVWKTTNGGGSWTKQNTAAFTGAASWCDGVHFFDANVGVAFGDPASSTATDFEGYRTTDGGATWTSLASAFPNIDAGDFGYAGSFTAVGDAMWFTTAKGKLYKTTNKGATWVKLSTPILDFGGGDTAGSSGRAYFSDANNGIIIGTTTVGTTTTRKLYKTTNGGSTWSPGVDYTSIYNYNIAYIPGTTVLVGNGVTGSGMSAVFSTGKSVDNGTTWTLVNSGDQKTTIAFLNYTTGWAGGFSSTPFDGGIYKFNGDLANSDFNTTKFKVYPNPSSSIVNISTEGFDSYSLRVTDLSGKVMTTREFNGIENTLDISSYATGMYFFEINSGNASETVKIIKN